MVNSFGTVEKEEIKQDYDDDDLCLRCHTNPRFVPYEFCSGECGKRCLVYGCEEPREELSPFCSQPHEDQTLCCNCGKNPRHLPYPYCSRACGEQCLIPGCDRQRAIHSMICANHGVDEDGKEAKGDVLVWEELCVKCEEKPRAPGYETCSRECGRLCRVPDCLERRFQGSAYCSQQHRKAAVSLGLALGCHRCGIAPREPGSRYCGRNCSSHAGQPAPIEKSPISADQRTPHPPNRHMKPRSAYQVSFGEYKGKPNFLLRSKRGLTWDNLPRYLHRLCSQAEMANQIIDFSLGTAGRYYVAYRVKRQVHMATSPNLWTEVDEDFHGGSLRHIQFGASGTFWGLKAYRRYPSDEAKSPQGSTASGPPGSPPTYSLRQQENGLRGSSEEKRDPDSPDVRNPFADRKTPSPFRGSRLTDPLLPTDLQRELPYVVQEDPFGEVPSSLVTKTIEIYPELKHHGQVDFVAIGMGGASVIGVMGKLCFWAKLDASVVRKLAKVYTNGGSLRNVVLSPCRSDIYFVEAKDASVQYHVPDEWHAKMKLHLTLENALDIDPPVIHKSTSLTRMWRGPILQAPPSPQAADGPPPYLPFPIPVDYNVVDSNTFFQTTFPSSGVMQTQQRKNQVPPAGRETTFAIVKSKPGNMGTLITVGSKGGGCAIM